MKQKENLVKKSVAITGGSGFVGTCLREFLSSKGYRIYNYDLVEPKSKMSSETYFKCDITDASGLGSVWIDADYVIHLAAVVGVTECQVSPVFSNLTNFIGTQNVCEVVRKQAVIGPIVFASSSAVYGNPDTKKNPITETQLLNPLSFYGSQKKWSEDLLRLYVKDFGLRATALRFFNIFGIGQKYSSPYSGVISKFCYRLSQNQLLELYNHGESTRDFIHVKDAARAIYQAMIFNDSNLKADFQAFNIGTGQATTVKHIACQLISIAQTYGFSSNFILKEARSEEIAHSLASSQLAQRVLAWKPEEKLDAHLQSIFESILQLRK